MSMTDENMPLPPVSGGGRLHLANFRTRLADESPAKRNSLGRQFWAALTVSIVGGSLAGLTMGGDTGVRSAIEAGRRMEAVIPAQTSPAKTAVASAAGGQPDAAHLLEDIRGLRAQIEQMRHTAETQRSGERLRTLEAAQATNADLEQDRGRELTALANRITEIDARLERLERAGADATPVGAIIKPPHAPSPEKAGRQKAR